MQIIINVKKGHLYGFLVGLVVILGAFMVTAFGGSSPSIMGHSALELIVNGSSVVDNSLGAADIDSTSLASECVSITGSASLCDGSDQDTDTDTQCDDVNCGTISVTGIQDPFDSTVDITEGLHFSSGNGPVTANGGVVQFQADILMQASGGRRIVLGTGTPIVNNAGTFIISENGGPGGNPAVRAGDGSRTMMTCTGCPSFDYYGPNACVGGCSSTDSGFRTS